MTTHVLAKSKEKLFLFNSIEEDMRYLIISFDKHCSFRYGCIYVSLFGSRKWLFWFFAFLDAKSSKQNNWWGSRNQKGRMVSWFWCPYGIGGKETKLLDRQVKCNIFSYCKILNSPKYSIFDLRAGWLSNFSGPIFISDLHYIWRVKKNSSTLFTIQHDSSFYLHKSIGILIWFCQTELTFVGF